MRINASRYHARTGQALQSGDSMEYGLWLEGRSSDIQNNRSTYRDCANKGQVMTVVIYMCVCVCLGHAIIVRPKYND